MNENDELKKLIGIYRIQEDEKLIEYSKMDLTEIHKTALLVVLGERLEAKNNSYKILAKKL